MNLIAELERLIPALSERLDQASSLPDVEELNITYLGRKGLLAGLMGRLPELAPPSAPPSARRPTPSSWNWPPCSKPRKKT